MRRFAAVALIALAGYVSPAAAQGRKGGAAVPRPAPRRPNRPQQNPARELERFQKMSPADRQKELDRLPPERRAQVEQRLQRLDRLSPAQREKELRRLEAFQNLDPQRRNAVRQELQNLRSLSPEERKARLSSEDVKKNFSSDEQKILHEASGQPELL
ncbi:MAG: DUF3106 domain-containing protein [Acidobacteriia bacterium]|nr:DUF3106 domain-containing protein [Terriglobia bacterium]